RAVLRAVRPRAACTYAALAALIAYLPAGLAAAKPAQPAPVQGEQKVLRPGWWLAVSTAAYAGAWAYELFLSPHGGDDQMAGALIFGGGFAYVMMLAVCVAIMVDLRREKRPRGRVPRRASPRAGGRGAARRPA